ncbi:myosin-6-like [Clytia hemisphaerica]|uniref:myosin-6-like n=1 Tax=Clytia hemisphaerica TaxID=252671 RepID=UPI0034D697E1
MSNKYNMDRTEAHGVLRDEDSCSSEDQRGRIIDESNAAGFRQEDDVATKEDISDSVQPNETQGDFNQESRSSSDHIKALKVENERLRQEQNRKEIEASTLRAKCETLKTRVDSLENENHRLENDNNELKLSLDKIEKSRLKVENDKLRFENTSLKSEKKINDLLVEKKALSDEMQMLRKDLSQEKTGLESQNVKIAKCETEKESLRKELEEAQILKENILRVKHQIEGELSLLKENHANQTQKLGEFQTENESLKKGIQEMCNLNESLEKKLLNSEAEKTMIEEGKGKLNTGMNDLNEKFTQLLATHTQLLAIKNQDDKEKENLKHEVRELEESYKRFSTNELSHGTLSLDIKVIKSVEVNLQEMGYYGLGYRIGNTVVLKILLSERYHKDLRLKMEKNWLYFSVPGAVFGSWTLNYNFDICEGFKNDNLECVRLLDPKHREISKEMTHDITDGYWKINDDIKDFFCKDNTLMVFIQMKNQEL